MEHGHRCCLAFAATAPPDYVPADEPEEEEGEGENDPPVDDYEDEEAALRQAIEASELEELGRWPDLAVALRASAEEAANQAAMEVDRAGWQVPWSPWEARVPGQAYAPPPAWPQEPQALATPPAAPAPPAWLYTPPAYVVLSDKDE